MTDQTPDTDFMSLEKLAEKMRPLAGQVVLLYGTELARFHGVAEDSMDFYYITECRRNGLMWNSAVGGVTPIKDRLGEDYDVLEGQFNRDGIPSGPFQVIRSERLRKVWLEGEPEEIPGLEVRIQDALDKELDELDATARWQEKRGAAAMVDGACDVLRAEGLDEFKVEAFRREAAGQHDEAHETAEAGAYAYPLNALLRRQDVLRQRVRESISRQFSVILRAAGRQGSTADLMPMLAGLDRTMPLERGGQDLLNDMRYLCDEVLEGKRPTYDEEADDPILDAIASQVPMIGRFLTIWLEERPALTARWAERGSIPVWLPAAAFCIANWDRFAKHPCILKLDDAQAAVVRADLEAAA